MEALLAILLIASWGPSGCGPVGSHVKQLPALGSLVVTVDDPNAVLTIAGVVQSHRGLERRYTIPRTDAQVGSYDLHVRWPDGSVESRQVHFTPGQNVTTSFVHPPRSPTGERMYFGVDLAKLQENQRERTTVNGQEVMLSTAKRLIGGGELVDDSKKLRLTCIGSASECKPFVDGLTAEARAKYLIQEYRPEDAMLTGMGFAAGHPSIYLQDPAGRVLLRRDGYDGALAFADALRKADPTYDPLKDPDGKPKPIPSPLSGIDWWGVITKIGLAITLLIGVLVLIGIGGPMILKHWKSATLPGGTAHDPAAPPVNHPTLAGSLNSLAAIWAREAAERKAKDDARAAEVAALKAFLEKAS